jgi:hypothetical protein
VPNDDWWQNFGDPVLDDLVALAHRVNPDVRTAGMRIMEARAQLGIAGSLLYPQLQQVTAEALGTGEQKANGRAKAFWSTGVGFNTGWEIDFWGKFRRGIESADAAYFASISDYDDVQVLVAAQTASAYTAIREIERLLAIVHENAAIQRRSLEITEKLFGAATIPNSACSRHARNTWARWRRFLRSKAACARHRTRCACSSRGPWRVARTGGPAREDPRGTARHHCRAPGRALAAAPRRARGRTAARGPVGTDRRQQGGALPGDIAHRDDRAVGHLIRVAAHQYHQGGRRPDADMELPRQRPADEPGAGAGRGLPGAVRAVALQRALRAVRVQESAAEKTG